MTFPYSAPAIRVSQPLGEFYICSLPADLLLQLTYSDRLRVLDENPPAVPYKVRGSQREQFRRKLREIAGYIDTVEAAFPNSIILGANYTESGQLIDDEALRWSVEPTQGGHRIVIPTATRLASIIDGQHRLQAFNFVAPNRRTMELLCAVYLDLPHPFDAYLFATINFNQKKVDRSLAYELFGYDLENEPAIAWSPEKAAVFFCRKLNTESDSPLAGHIRVVAANADILMSADGGWYVSTAAVVDGILRLISANPKRDKDEMHKLEIPQRTRSVLPADRTPLRTLFLEGNDLAVYTAVKNFFSAAAQALWGGNQERSYIRKTVGIQALFDILKQILLRDFQQQRDISIPYFRGFLDRATTIDFANDYFQASGKGRSRISCVLSVASELKTMDEMELSPEDRIAVARLTNR